MLSVLHPQLCAHFANACTFWQSPEAGGGVDMISAVRISPISAQHVCFCLVCTSHVTLCNALPPWCRYAGSQGIYTHTVAYERNPQCPVCSPGIELTAPADSTLQQVRVVVALGWVLAVQVMVQRTTGHCTDKQGHTPKVCGAGELVRLQAGCAGRGTVWLCGALQAVGGGWAAQSCMEGAVSWCMLMMAVCTPPLHIQASNHPVCCLVTVWQVIDRMLEHPVLAKMLAHPSVSNGTKQLYSRGVFEASTKANLAKPIAELLEGETTVLLTVNDKKLSAPLRVRLRLQQ